jgi:hypothetical protein
MIEKSWSRLSKIFRLSETAHPPDLARALYTINLMASNQSAEMYHGTPYAIHESSRPFLDPALAGHMSDDGDPKEPYVFGTPDLFMASLFALKNPHCRAILDRTDYGPVAVYDGLPPNPDDEGCVYSIPSEGFEQTRRRNGELSGKWAIVASRMPYIRYNGIEVPGLAVGEPVRRVTMRNLVEKDKLRVCTFTGKIAVQDFLEILRRAVLEPGGPTSSVRTSLDRGWIEDITSDYWPAVAPTLEAAAECVPIIKNRDVGL